jgi:hypothetical protein
MASDKTVETKNEQSRNKNDDAMVKTGCKPQHSWKSEKRASKNEKWESEELCN